MPISLKDHLAIQHLNARYAQTIDAGDAAGWAACFALHGVFASASGVDVRGHAELGAFAERAAAAPGAGLRRHWAGPIVADERDGAVTARCYGMVVEGGETPSVVASVVYEDELDRAGDGWVFRRRAVHVVA
jgi:hypothetical protein